MIQLVKAIPSYERPAYKISDVDSNYYNMRNHAGHAAKELWQRTFGRYGEVVGP